MHLKWFVNNWSCSDFTWLRNNFVISYCLDNDKPSVNIKAASIRVWSKLFSDIKRLRISSIVRNWSIIEKLTECKSSGAVENWAKKKHKK